MITCQNAKHLFDRYLDGDLSPSMQAELHAHQLKCSECQGELALLEACGDVVAYDQREPKLSASFTDRVLLAQRARQAVPAQRNWGRRIVTVASPLAAAACIAFAVLLIAPTQKNMPESKVLSQGVSASSGTKAILDPDGKNRTAASNLPNVEEMPAGFVDAILGPIVEQAKGTVDNTKRSFEQLDSLVRLGIAGANDALAASEPPAADAALKIEPVLPQRSVEPSPLDPAFLHHDPVAPEPVTEIDETVEAL